MMKKIFKSSVSFLKIGFVHDMKNIRSRVSLFFFNFIPDFFLLIPIRNLILILGGGKVPFLACYIRSPFYCGNLSNLTVGPGVFINKHAYIESNASVKIGEKCQIGPYFKVENTNHVNTVNMNTALFPVVVEASVWIGSGVILLPKAYIESHSIVAAGAVVSGKLEGHKTYGGVPAKQLLKRNPS